MTEMRFELQRAGGRYYHLAEGERSQRYLTLSKASLGAFCHGVLVVGGDIIQLWPFNRRYPRSSVLAVVAMTPQMKEQFEKETGFLLCDPPVVSTASTLAKGNFLRQDFPH